jgi:hypothetical protein
LQSQGVPKKAQIRMCVSSMVMVQRWNVAAMGGAPAPTRLWREEHVEVISHLMRLVGSSSSSDVPFFWCRINWLNIYHVMKLYIGSWVMGLSMVCMKGGVCPLYTDPNCLCTFPPNCWETQQEPPPILSQKGTIHSTKVGTDSKGPKVKTNIMGPLK